MAARKRDKDGLGYGERSFQKHRLIGIAASTQVSILNRSIGGKGIIVDMHAGSGNGVALPQLDLFELAVSETSPSIAARLANQCTPHADVILCESRHDRRISLRETFAYDRYVQILSTNNKLLTVDFEKYDWALILNDPCGHSKHAVEVMISISQKIHCSDFIIVVNEGSLQRHLGVGSQRTGDGEDAPLIQHVRATKEKYAWMLDPQEWRKRLEKKDICWSAHRIANQAFHGRVLVASNYLGERLRRREWKAKEYIQNA